MCIVIDVNALSPVFNADDSTHTEFVLLEKWIREGDGVLVFGGTKYKDELGKMERYLNLVGQLKRQGNAVAISDAVVDELQDEVRDLVTNRRFNDHHIIAILAASGCRLLCTLNSRHDGVFTDRDAYPDGVPKRKIYRRSGHQRMLCGGNIVNLTNAS